MVLDFVGALRSRGTNNATRFSARYVGRGKERHSGGGGPRGVASERTKRSPLEGWFPLARPRANSPVGGSVRKLVWREKTSCQAGWGELFWML